MAQLLLLRGAKQLLTLRGPSGIRRGAALDDLGMIEDGSVLIEDGRIISVGTTRRLENLKRAKGALDVPAYGCVVMPAFADPAVNLTIYDRRQTASSFPKRKRAAHFSQEALTLVRACLQHGTMSAQLKVYSHGGAYSTDVAALRHLVGLGSNPIGTVRSLRLSAQLEETALPEVLASLIKLRHKKIIDRLEVDCENHPLAGEAFWNAMSRAGVPVNLRWPGGSAEVLLHLLAKANPHAVFCPAELSAAECAGLAQWPCLSVFSPCKDLLEERENPSVKKLAAAGGAIALASGYDSKDAPIFSMQTVVALAVLRLRLSVEQAISATTINAAHVLGIGSEVGSIEVGKKADLLVMNLSDYREIPRRFGLNHVGMAIREGNLVINRRRTKASAG